VPKVINEAHVECLRQENSQLREENVALNERLNNLGSVLSDLNTKLKTSEEEKASLLTAIRLLQTDIETGCKTALNHQSQITHKEANAISKGNNTIDGARKESFRPWP
jgi:predicted nuclease with TOPRIM domain